MLHVWRVLTSAVSILQYSLTETGKTRLQLSPVGQRAPVFMKQIAYLFSIKMESLYPAFGPNVIKVFYP